MEALVVSGRIVDLIAAGVLAEAALLAILTRRMRRAPPFREVAGSLAAGFFLLLALRAALTGSSWVWIAAALAAAGVAHVADQAVRWGARPRIEIPEPPISRST